MIKKRRVTFNDSEFKPSDAYLTNYNPISDLPPSSERKDQISQGYRDAIKESKKEEEKNKEKFETLVDLSKRELLRIKTVFPFQFFPTEVSIDINKVNIIKQIFFATKRIHSVFIADITDVLAHSSIFFASLEIVDAGFTENSIIIPYLYKNDAYRARKIIQGLVIAKKQDIDLSKLENVHSLVTKIEELGGTRQPV